MITYWQIISNGLLPIQNFQDGCIVNIVEPTAEELQTVKTTFKVAEDIISDIMDVDERSRMDIDEEEIVMILRIPIYNPGNGIPYTTIPLGIIMTENTILVLCLRNNELISDIFNKRVRKKMDMQNKIDFILGIFLAANLYYHKYLKLINQQSNIIEQSLEKSTKNEELNKLLKVEKCLVYFITSLRSNDLLIEKLKNSKLIQNSGYSEELLDDVVIENKQAIEMANIYSDILGGMMDAFASVISNNLNNVMKQLTIITIILMIPTLIASLYGMNVPNFFENNNFAFVGIIIVSVLLTVIGVLIIRNRKWM